LSGGRWEDLVGAASTSKVFGGEWGGSALTSKLSFNISPLSLVMSGKNWEFYFDPMWGMSKFDGKST
jgi:hypothetical protein